MPEPDIEDEVSIPDLAGRVTTSRNADIYFFAGGIDNENADEFCRAVLLRQQRRPNALLLLTTFGGSGDAAFRMARSLQQAYDGGTVSLLVNSYCKSAGTLVAIGANEILMTDLAELGPLDVQITKPDTLGERTSGLTPSQALTTLRYESFQCFEKFFLDVLKKSGFAITAKTAAIIAGRVTTGLYRPVFAQIDPMRLGEFQRAVQVAMEYGRRLDEWAKNLADPYSLVRLINGYPSHEFVIDLKEAKTLFKRVSRPKPEEFLLSELLRSDAEHAQGKTNADIRYLSPEPTAPAAGSGDGKTPRKTRPRSAGARTSSARNGRAFGPSDNGATA